MSELTVSVPASLVLDPGCVAQATVAAVLTSSLARVHAAPAGLLTVAELPPAASVSLLPRPDAGGTP